MHNSMVNILQPIQEVFNGKTGNKRNRTKVYRRIEESYICGYDAEEFSPLLDRRTAFRKFTRKQKNARE